MRAKPLTQTGITSTSSGVLYYVDNYQRIHQLFWGGSQWLDADLMSSSGSGYNVAPGSGVAVDANGILYYADTSGDVHQMYWGGAKFMDADLMASSGSGVKAQAGTGSSVDANGNVYYVSTGQTVHQMWWGGTQMMDADLMASSGSGVQVDSATEITLDSDATIYYVSTDGAVHKMYWGGSNFLDTRLMSVSSQPNSRAESGTGVAIDSNLNVYYVDTAQTVHQMLWNGSEFADSNLMSSSGSGMLVSLGTQPWVDSSGNVYYVDTSQNIHKMYWGGSQWLDTNLMSSSGIGYLAQGDSEGAVDGSGNVYYISMNQNIYQMFWNGTQYQDINLMASSGSGVVAAARYTISGQVSANVSGLSGALMKLTGTRNFSATTDANGYYSFAVPAGGSYQLTSSLAGYSFSPGSQFLANAAANQVANFVVPTVTITNLSNPSISPNFAVGDTFQISVSGAPNQPVTVSQTPGGTSQQGSTDANGNFSLTGAEQTSNIGGYTQVWSVGGVQISPAISFAVGSLGAGTVSSTDIGETTDGHLEGFSTISINNGTVTAYSETALDYSASLYYDSQTVATLFDDGTEITQKTAGGGSDTSASLGATGSAWDDYTLQTDHYAVAYLVSDSSYENPLYWGSDCGDDTEDCTISGPGGYSFYISTAYIYLGSTIADQSYVPDNDLPPAFSISAYNGFLAASGSSYPTGLSRSPGDWILLIGASYTAVKVVYDAFDAGRTNPNGYPPIPAYVDLVGDVDDIGNAERQRTFVIRDIYGRPWNMNFPLRIRERFSDMAAPQGLAPLPSGIWYANLPELTDGDQPIDNHSQFTDHHHGVTLNAGVTVSYLQYYYATDFNLPPSSLGLTPFFAVTGVSGSAMPLWIRDKLNKCSPFPELPAEGLTYSGRFIYVDGDEGPGTACQQ